MLKTKLMPSNPKIRYVSVILFLGLLLTVAILPLFSIHIFPTWSERVDDFRER